MPDIIVTTPKNCIALAAEEARECIEDGWGEYFRRFSGKCCPVSLKPGVRIFYVMDGYLRGFAEVNRIANIPRCIQCDVSGRWYQPGVYAWMPADTWQWIEPLVMRGFQGYRYLVPGCGVDPQAIRVVGGWLDPMPETEGE